MKTGILLLHGLTGAPAEMHYLASYLRDRGFDVECPLLPGHGGGTRELFATKAEDWVRGSIDEFRKLQSRCDNVFVLGLCAGAVLSALVAAAEPRVAGVVLLAPFYGTMQSDNTKLRYLLPLIYLIPWLRKRIYWPQGPNFGVQDKRVRMVIAASLNASKVKDTCERGMFVTYVESFYQSDRLAKMLRRQAKEVTCPALFIHSLEDTFFGPDNSLRLAHDIASTDKTVLMIDGCDHVITIDLRKQYVAEQVELFIKSRTESEKKAI